MTKIRPKAAMRKTQPIIGLKNQQAARALAGGKQLFRVRFCFVADAFSTPLKTMLAVALICSSSRAKLLLFPAVFCFELLCQRFNVKNAAKKLKLTTRNATAPTRKTVMNLKIQNAAVNP